MKLGIIGAMEMEVALLKEQMTEQKVSTIAMMDFCEGRIGDKDVVIVRSGVAKVNAGICVQILVDRFNVTHLINTGCAGSLNNDIEIGDIVVSTGAMYHDVDATFFGYHLGEVPQLGVTVFKANEELIEKTVQAINETTQVKAFKGMVLSGDQFINTHAKKMWLMENFDGYCAEMEGAAIAQGAYLNDVPFVIVRAISDKADESSMMAYDEFERKAAHDCASLVRDLIDIL